MITVEIKGTINALDGNGEQVTLKLVDEIEVSSFESAKYAAGFVLDERAATEVMFFNDHGHDLTIVSVHLDSIVDRENNQHHYGQLPRHYYD